MVVFRWLMLLMLIASAVCFVFYAGTGQKRFRDMGLKVLKWTIAAASLFFFVLILERVA